ncbi:hypothetical protein F2Q69_00008035 [Brassica cretica]|uniref:Uncharacterized protein n=1 Tax=Brassica cretica TaxID=69181 RepID=A0A8S9P9K7_BRACR|nr:hypothetical protein F2Q69_00008035 [Brassica cretica]
MLGLGALALGPVADGFVFVRFSSLRRMVLVDLLQGDGVALVVLLLRTPAPCTLKEYAVTLLPGGHISRLLEDGSEVSV